MSSYKGFEHIQNQYIMDKIVVGAIKEDKVYVFICNKPNCETEWEDVCFCIDNGTLLDIRNEW
jgi:hypothetical protein